MSRFLTIMAALSLLACGCESPQERQKRRMEEAVARATPGDIRYACRLDPLHLDHEKPCECSPAQSRFGEAAAGGTVTLGNHGSSGLLVIADPGRWDCAKLGCKPQLVELHQRARKLVVKPACPGCDKRFSVEVEPPPAPVRLELGSSSRLVVPR